MPRDPERIDKILGIIRKYWCKHSDLRLGQLLLAVVVADKLFYMEDDELIKLLKEQYE